MNGLPPLTEKDTWDDIKDEDLPVFLINLKIKGN